MGLRNVSVLTILILVIAIMIVGTVTGMRVQPVAHMVGRGDDAVAEQQTHQFDGGVAPTPSLKLYQAPSLRRSVHFPS